jgi:nucleoside-diphosphate-sugar epimerase
VITGGVGYIGSHSTQHASRRMNQADVLKDQVYLWCIPFEADLENIVATVVIS